MRTQNVSPSTELLKLYNELKLSVVELTDSLPVFGPRFNNNPTECWSWDNNFIIVGTCVGDLEIRQYVVELRIL
jgi:hypothetical protein